jgi:hypothetical protein
MPIPGAKYRYKKGTDVRLAFKDGEVAEAKNMKTGAIHTPEEFAADRKKKTKEPKGPEPIKRFMNRRNKKEGRM